ncbi:hypothetical protein [Geoglobus acetivorans]|uniref:Uncharacterized protein n=1 Tax=Geoglobus acetivorans TaxID=565033 RepID=A0A0A7GEW5_GEOAI|nr:hypothetical protein GACE_1549 [Geoglobus acetivorans]
MRLKASIDDFRKWLEERGYRQRLGDGGLNAYLESGFPALFFSNSQLLYAFIYSNLGFESERVNERIRFELARRINAIFLEKDYMEIEFSEPAS